MIKIKNLIIGGGISGLAFANFCKSSYMIIEKDDSVGGLCRTFYQGGYVWDYAGHFFHFSDSKIKRLFNDKISKEDLTSLVEEYKELEEKAERSGTEKWQNWLIL